MRSALLAAFSMIAIASACSSTSGPGATAVGAYNLVSVNGATVPAVTQNDATIKTEILNGSLVLYGDNTFSEYRWGHVTLSGGTQSPTIATQSGTWSKSGTQLSFVSGTVQNPVSFAGTYVAGSLTYASAGTTFVYKQQSMGDCANC
jgi:coproporphyrinogen III oxidase